MESKNNLDLIRIDSINRSFDNKAGTEKLNGSRNSSFFQRSNSPSSEVQEEKKLSLNEKSLIYTRKQSNIMLFKEILPMNNNSKLLHPTHSKDKIVTEVNQLPNKIIGETKKNNNNNIAKTSEKEKNKYKLESSRNNFDKSILNQQIVDTQKNSESKTDHKNKILYENYHNSDNEEFRQVEVDIQEERKMSHSNIAESQIYNNQNFVNKKSKQNEQNNIKKGEVRNLERNLWKNNNTKSAKLSSDKRCSVPYESRFRNLNGIKNVIISEGNMISMRSVQMSNVPSVEISKKNSNNAREISLLSNGIPSRVQSSDNLMNSNNPDFQSKIKLSVSFNDKKKKRARSKDINSDKNFKLKGDNENILLPNKNLPEIIENNILKKSNNDSEPQPVNSESQREYISLSISRMKDIINLYFQNIIDKEKLEYLNKSNTGEGLDIQESPYMKLISKNTFSDTPSDSKESNDSSAKEKNKIECLEKQSKLLQDPIYKFLKKRHLPESFLTNTYQVGMLMVFPQINIIYINGLIIVDNILIINNQNEQMNFDIENHREIFIENRLENNVYIEIGLDERNPIINNQNELMDFPDDDDNENIFEENNHRYYD